MATKRKVLQMRLKSSKIGRRVLHLSKVFFAEHIIVPVLVSIVCYACLFIGLGGIISSNRLFGVCAKRKRIFSTPRIVSSWLYEREIPFLVGGITSSNRLSGVCAKRLKHLFPTPRIVSSWLYEREIPFLVVQIDFNFLSNEAEDVLKSLPTFMIFSL